MRAVFCKLACDLQTCFPFTKKLTKLSCFQLCQKLICVCFGFALLQPELGKNKQTSKQTNEHLLRVFSTNQK